MMNVRHGFIMALQILVFSVGTANVWSTDAVKTENTAVAGKPKMVFEAPTFDFGKIYIGENVVHRFVFKNSGPGELVINSVKSSCGCTAAVVSKTILPKGETGELEVKFNPGHFVGKVTKSVMVNSNDPENPKCKVTITGEVIEEVRVNPKLINFGIIRRGDSCTKTLEINTVPDLKVKVTKVESPNSYISIARKSQGETPDDAYQVTFGKYDYLGKVNGMVFVYTSSARQERVDVPFSAEVVGDVTFYPETLSFGAVYKGQDVKKTVIVNFINKDVRIEKIEAEPGIISYAESTLNATSRKIDVRFSDEGRTPGKVTGSLKIHTTSAIQPLLVIPILGEIKG